MNGQRQPQVERTGRSEAADERLHRSRAYPLNGADLGAHHRPPARPVARCGAGCWLAHPPTEQTID